MFILPLNDDGYVGRTPYVIIGLIIANGLILAATYLIASSQSVFSQYGFIPAQPHILTMFSSLFLHAGIFHYLGNMFFLWMFGRELEIVWGRNRFLRYYFLTGVGAGLINLIVKAIPLLWGRALADLDAPTIGASGAIFGVLLACAVLFPDRQVMFMFAIKMSMRTLMIVLIALEFLGTFGLGGDNISHFCHFGGMLVGYIYLRRGSFLYGVRNTLSDWQYRRNRKRFEVYINKHKGEPPEPPSRPDRWVN